MLLPDACCSRQILHLWHKILPVLSFTMDPFSAVGLAASIIQTLDAIGKLVKYANAVKRAPAERARLAREATSLMALLTELRYDVEKNDFTDAQMTKLCQNADGPLNEVYQTVQKLSKKLKQKKRCAKLWGALTWPIDKQEVDDTLVLVERLKSSITLSLVRDTAYVRCQPGFGFIRRLITGLFTRLLAVNIDSGVTELKQNAANERTGKKDSTRQSQTQN